MIYQLLHQNRNLVPLDYNLQSLIKLLRETAYDLEKMLDAGVVLEDKETRYYDYYYLQTENERVAKDFGLTPIEGN